MPTVDAPLVGMKYHEGAAEKLESLAMGDTVALIREPENEHDENAIQVFALGEQDILLGYIAREHAAQWAPTFDEEGISQHPAKLTFSSTGYPRIEVELPGKDSEEEEDEEDAVQED